MVDVETQTVEKTVKVTQNAFAEELSVDEDGVFYERGGSTRIPVETARTAVDALEAGAEKVVLDSEMGVQMESRSRPNSGGSDVMFRFPCTPRATSVESLRELFDAAEEHGLVDE